MKKSIQCLFFSPGSKIAVDSFSSSKALATKKDVSRQFSVETLFNTRCPFEFKFPVLLINFSLCYKSLCQFNSPMTKVSFSGFMLAIKKSRKKFIKILNLLFTKLFRGFNSISWLYIFSFLRTLSQNSSLPILSLSNSLKNSLQLIISGMK